MRKENRPIYVWACITILLILYFVVRILMPKSTYCSDEVYEFQQEGSVIPYEMLQLKAGVYRVELLYEAEYDGTEPIAYTTIQDPTVRNFGLLTNGEHIYAGLTGTSYQFWLFESADALEMRVDLYKTGFLRLLGYRITETSLLWTRYLAITLCVSAVVLCVLLLKHRWADRPVPRESRNAFFFMCIIVTVAVMPYLYGGSNYSGIDMTYHMQRIEGIAAGFRSGQIPVRIEPEWLFGRGYGAAIFYCDLLLYFPAFLRLIGFTVSESYNAYCIGVTALTAYLAYYSFRRIFRDKNIGLLCSALYTLSVFRIYKLVITCDMGEGSAVAFMPLVLYGLYRVFTEDPKSSGYKTAWIPVAIGYAGLFQTHTLTCLITAVLTVLLCLICIKKVFCKETFIQLAKGALTAMGLGAWFLVPFLDFYLTQNMHVKNWADRKIQESGLTLAHLGFQFWGRGNYTPNNETGVYLTYPVGVGMILILGFGLFLVLYYKGALKNCGRPLAQLAGFSAVLGGLLLWMSTRLFPWDWISSLSPVTSTMVGSLEFTNRVLGWGTLFLVTLCGFCFYYMKERERRFYVISIVVTVICLLTSTVYMLEISTSGNERSTIYNEEGMGYGFISDGEFLLEGTDSSILTFEKDASPGENVEIMAYDKKYLVAELNCVNTGSSESFVEVPLTYYRGYRATDMETGERLDTVAGDNNAVRVNLPAGYEGNFEVKFHSPVYWRLSEAVSIVTLVWFLWRVRKEREKNVR